MGAFLTSLLQGVGRTGNEYAEGKQINAEQAAAMQKHKQDLQLLQAQLQGEDITRQRQSAPEVKRTWTGPDGKTYQELRDPLTGQTRAEVAPGPGQMSELQQRLMEKEQAVGRKLTPGEIQNEVLKPQPKPVQPRETAYDREAGKLRADADLKKIDPAMYAARFGKKTGKGSGGGAGGGQAPGPLSPIDERYAQRLANKDISISELEKIYVGKNNQQRKAVIDRSLQLGGNANAALTPAAEKVIMQVDPTIKQVDSLLADIENLGLKNNNEAGYLFKERAKYAMGMTAPAHTLGQDIAGFSLGSVVEASTALMGVSKSIQALNKALEHTPNTWKDSPAQMFTQLTDIRTRLADIMSDARKYGTKSGLENKEEISPQHRPPLGTPKAVPPPNAPQAKSGKAAKASATPTGATMKVPGSDGKMHWSDGKKDLGLAE